MGRTEPRPDISSKKPFSRVLCLPLVTSTLVQLTVVIAFQLWVLEQLRRQKGYTASLGAPDLKQVRR